MNEVSPLNGTAHEPVFSHPVGEYRVFRVDPNDEYSSKFIHRVVIRALEFLDRFEVETDPLWLTQIIYNTFRQRPHLICICIAVNDKEEIVAHSIALVDQNKDGPICNVQQMVSEARDSEVVKKGMEITGEWARSLKLKYATATTISDAITRYDKRYGFKPWRTILRLEL